MNISATVREYLINVVCNSSGGEGGGEGGRSLRELKGHFQAYLHVYERAMFGNGVLTHGDWQYFASNYDYIYQTLMVVKQKELLLARLAKHKRKTLFTSSTFNNAGAGRPGGASSGYKTGRTKANKGRRSSLSMSVVGDLPKAGETRRHSRGSTGTFHKRNRSKDDAKL